MFFRVSVLVVAALLVIACTGGRSQTFDDFIALEASDTYADWVVMGRFGPDGPFEVAAEIDFDLGEDATFTHVGTPHKYPLIPGYRFKVLKLRGKDGSESTVVLRSREKV